MNKLNGLIQELCPDGVEYKKVKEAFQRLRGTPITAGKMKEIEDPTGEIKIFAGGKTIINAKEENIPNANITRVPAVLVQSRGVIDVVYYDKPFTFKNEMWAYTADNEIKVKYLYYVLKNNIQGFRDAASGMGSLPQISLPVTEDFRIPLPPLPVQREIVRILDNFTELTAELTAELAARRKQYEHYRDELLTFGDDVPKVPLRELFNTQNGYTPSKAKPEFWSNGTIPWFRMEDIRENGRILDQAIQTVSLKAIKGKPFPVNSIIVATSATIGEHALVTVESLANQRFTYLMLKDEYKERVNIKFLFYYCFLLDEYCLSCLNQGNFASVDMVKFGKFLFSIPPIEEQNYIVDQLDRFDTLCNDLTSGLPAEIAARQKQYEYYRGKLLTFKELEG